MSVSDYTGFNLLLHLGTANSEAIAFVDSEGRSLSYADLHRQTCELRSQILEQTSGQIGRCITLLPDHPTTVILQLALLGNCTLIPANPASNERELGELIEAVGAHSIVSRSANTLSARLAEQHSLRHINFEVDDETEFSCSAYISQRPKARDTQQEKRSDSAATAATALILPTSGSTGSPKLVPLEIPALAKSANNIAAHLKLDETDRALHILPMFHIGAIVDLVLAPLIRGASVYFAHGLAFDQLASSAQKYQVSWLQMVPTMLNRLLVESSEEELSVLGNQLRFVRSVSSDLPPAMQAEVEMRLAGTPVIQIYGMTETSGQIASNPLPPEERRPGTVGKACGAEILIMDAFGNPVDSGEEGEICVRGETLMSGYENFDSFDNSQAFFGAWLRSGDLGKLDSDGYLHICGRLKEIVNRGGEKIALQEIDRIALTHAQVMEAASFPVPHSSLGEEVAIAVVSSSGALTESALREHFTEHLAAHKCPRQIFLLQQLPKLGSGKIDRRALIKLNDTNESNDIEAENLKASAYKPQSLNERLVSRLWSKILRTKRPVPGDDFFEAGGDSLAATGFLASLEKATKKTFPSDLLYKAPTYEKLVQAIDEIEGSGTGKGKHSLELPKPIFDAVRQSTAAWPGRRRTSASLIIEHNSIGDKQCFFWCGNGRDNFEDIVANFGADRPVYVLRTLSGLKQKSKANTDLLAAHYALEIEQIEPETPICIGGVCQGAVLARKIVEKLVDRGREIKLVVFVDRVFVEPFDSPTLLIWSGSSQYSARVVYANPQAGLPRLYSAGAEALNHSKSHHELVLGDGAKELVEQMEPYLDGAKVISPAHLEPEETFERRKQLYQAVIASRVPRFIRTGSDIKLGVRITNTSDQDWSAKAGFSVAARWYNLDGHMRIVRAGGVEITQALAQNETTELEVEIEVPEKRLPHVLLIDLVDEGVGWFHQLGNNNLKSQIVLVY